MPKSNANLRQRRRPRKEEKEDDEDAVLDAALQENTQRGIFFYVVAAIVAFAAGLVLVLMVHPMGGGETSEQPSRKLQQNDDHTAPQRTIAHMTTNHQVLATHEHDPTAFTQGLTAEYRNGDLCLVESTGMYGESVLRVWDPVSGDIFKETAMDKKYFGEGLTAFDVHGSTYYMALTYKEGVALIYNQELELVETPKVPETVKNEGWGITYQTDDKETDELIFYVTDGSHNMYVWQLNYRLGEGSDQISFTSITETSRIPVSLKLQMPHDPNNVIDKPELPMLNELEYDANTHTILANIWFEPVLVRIDIATGQVVHVYNFQALNYKKENASQWESMNIVMNGIALVPGSTEMEGTRIKRQELYITGKYWPKVYHISVHD